MNVLLINTEAIYYGGAEVVLGYFLEGLAQRGVDATVALVKDSPLDQKLSSKHKRLHLPANQPFSFGKLGEQRALIRDFCKQAGITHIHGWSARSWELTAIAGQATKLPTCGTLHDHPQSPYISKARQLMMRQLACLGLTKVACVSDAVRQACITAGYPAGKLRVCHNGLPDIAAIQPQERSAINRPLRLGFLGAFSEIKGVDGLFEIIGHLHDSHGAEKLLEWHIAGDAQDEAGRALLADIRSKNGESAWWQSIHWHGWVSAPRRFLGTLDLLLLCSSHFDSLPTVVLEAASVGTPVLAANTGGVPEMIAHGENGWLYKAGDWHEAAQTCGQILEAPALLAKAGEKAWENARARFSVDNMVDSYMPIYQDLG